MNSESQKKPWYAYALAAAVGLIVAFKDVLVEYDLVLPVICVIILLGFSSLLIVGIKEWKKTDEEILRGYNQFDFSLPENRKNGDLIAIQAILAFAVFIGIILLSFGGVSVPAKAGVGIMAVVICVSHILANRLKKRSPRVDMPRKEPWITGREITAFLVGLISCAFMCFFIGAGIYHGAWWFVSPPGLVFLLFFSRPLAAAVRTVIRRARRDDEKHVRKGKETDPWDRPDADPERYRRK